MADTVEMQDIRGLDIDKTVKGFALIDYVFKSACAIVPVKADSIRWYQETSTELTNVAVTNTSSVYPIENVSPLSKFPFLEASWTRQTSYVRKYAAEGFLSMEDVASDDVNVLSRTLLRLTRAVIKKVDTRIWAVIADGYTSTAQTAPTNINTAAAAAPWNTASFTAVDIAADLMQGKLNLYNYGYNPEGATLFLSPTDYKYLVAWLIFKGANIPAFTSTKILTGDVTQLLGLNVRVSPNVAASGALIVIPNQAATWYQFADTTAVTIEEKGIGTKVRVWEIGEAVLTDPKACHLVTNTQTHV
jgi:hypothetical protein